MSAYDLIKGQLGAMVPFQTHAGVTLEEVADGEATASLPQTPTSINHIGSQHAGALYTLGEAASGAALAGALMPVLMTVRPVAAKAEIAYRKVAKGTITATAKTSRPGPELMAEIEASGKTVFAVNVSLTDGSGAQVAAMTVDWHVSKAR